MNKRYDVIIVGAGPAGIFAAYELTLKAPQLKVLLIDKGHDIDSRRCPILEEKIQLCPPPAGKKEYAGCLPACSITAGFGGAGAYSDGKFNITTEFGGWLTDYLPPSRVLDLIRYVDAINLKHGATENVTDPTTPVVRSIEQRGYAAGLKLLRAQVRHLGTEQNLEILRSINAYLKTKIDMQFKTEVADLLTAKTEDGHRIQGIVLKNGEEVEADKVLVAPGRDGSAWLTEVLRKRRLKMYNNQVDVGVRVETSDVVMHEINEHLYEGKFIFNTSVGTRVRTFCSNPSGHVVVENHSGVMAANGHAYKDLRLAQPIRTSHCWCRTGLRSRSISRMSMRGKYASGPTIYPAAGSSYRNTAILSGADVPRKRESRRAFWSRRSKKRCRAIWGWCFLTIR